MCLRAVAESLRRVGLQLPPPLPPQSSILLLHIKQAARPGARLT